MKSITADLLKWKKTLPPEILVDPNLTTVVHLPHTLLLHMQYHEVIIFANHPLISIPGKVVTDTRRRCAESARSIALLLQIYKQWWSLRRMNIQGVHTIFSAALVHLHVACTSENDSVRDLAVGDLRICCEALRDLTRAFKSASRALESLAGTRQLWQSWLETPATTSSNIKVPFSPPPPSFPTPDARRWIAIDDVIGQTSAMVQEAPPTEEVSWLEGWMRMQSMTETDPFSMAYATTAGPSLNL